jgi:UDP-2,4-diacetamido-2,4,6-trideoxy-beta-L-altropyranose hydrolase
MQIVFRTDASVQIGTGHVMRCLTLADALHLEGAECIFICRDHPGHLRDLIQQRGHHVQLLTAGEPLEIHNDKELLSHAAWLGTDWTRDASDTQAAITPYAVDWLVVDHYALDHRWERALRPFCQHVMVIDDLADRTHDCDLLLDQNLGRSAENYRDLVPKHATTLVGPQYALLRPEFSSLRQKSLARRKHPKLQHLLITFGGVDKNNLTGEVLETLRLCQLPADLQITVVMGAHAPWVEQVHAIANSMPLRTQVVINTNHMALLMADSDLCIGAAGGTALEYCCLGLPSWVMATATNQHIGAGALQKKGAVLLLENPCDVKAIFERTHASASLPELLRQLSDAASSVTDGKGARLVLQAWEDFHA